MAYTKIPVVSGDVISSAWGNHIQTQYEQAIAELTTEKLTRIPTINADVDGSEYPTGLTMMEVNTATGWPGRGVAINSKYSDFRFGQLYIENQLSGQRMMWRDWHTNGWSDWKEALDRVSADSRYARTGAANTFTQRQTFNNGVNISYGTIYADNASGRAYVAYRAGTAVSNGAGFNLYGDDDDSTSAGGFRLYTGGTTSMYIDKDGLVDIGGTLKAGRGITLGSSYSSDAGSMYFNGNNFRVNDGSWHTMWHSGNLSNPAQTNNSNTFNGTQTFNSEIQASSGINARGGRVSFGTGPYMDMRFTNNQYEFYPTGSGYQRPIMIGRNGNRVDMPGGATIEGNTAWHGGNNQSSINPGAGYQKLASGLIIQWINPGAVTSDGRTVNFPITFPTATLGGFGNSISSSAISVSVRTSISNRSSCEVFSESGTNAFIFVIGY